MLEIYTCGASNHKNGSSFAVILKDGEYEWRRSFSLGQDSFNRMALVAIKFGLLSVSKQKHGDEIRVLTDNVYALGMFAKGNDGFYKNNPSKNDDLVMWIRNFINDKNVLIQDTISPLLAECKELAISVAKQPDPNIKLKL